MKLKVVFREYMLPLVDPRTKKPIEGRGDYLGSFSEEIEGKTPGEILVIASQKAEAYSKENKTDVRVWETVIAISPRGICSR